MIKIALIVLSFLHFGFVVPEGLTKYNFGVVVNNDNYTILRSSELGKPGLEWLEGYLADDNLPFPDQIIYMNAEGYAFPLYFALEELDAQSEYGFKFTHSFGPWCSYVDGYDPGHPTEKINNGIFLGPIAKARGLSYHGPEQPGGADVVFEILKKILNGKVTLFHCLGGMHRTGMVAMLIRYMQDWKEEDIIAEYKRYAFLGHRDSNIKFVREFIKDPRFLRLKKKYGELLK